MIRMRIRYWNYGKKEKRIRKEWDSAHEFLEWLKEQNYWFKGRITLKYDNGTIMQVDFKGKRDVLLNDILKPCSQIGATEDG